MKRRILTLSLLALSMHAISQNTLRQTIRGERGVSKHFVTIAENQQQTFNAADAGKTFGIDAKSNLVLMNAEADKLGCTHYRYYQTYSGIPVENSMYIVHTKAGKLTGMSGSVVTDFDPQTDARMSASISSAQAINAAVKYTRAEKFAWEDPKMEQRIKMQTGKSNATYYPTAVKVWYNAGDEISPRELRLCYKVDVYTLKPFDRKFIFVDAQTGQVLGTKAEMEASDATGTANTQYSGSQTIHSDLNGSSYRLRDLTKGNGIITLNATGNADYTNTTANWNLTGQNQHAMDVHWGVEKTYEFYKTTFNRNSVDNNGFALTSYVNDGEIDNAHWDGSAMNYGVRSGTQNGVTGIDVTGHELTHGVTQNTSALNYSNESGAMNESMSDIMGKSVQFFAKPSDISWILSNDMNWEIRSFSNPNADGQPDTYKGTNWYSGTGDNGGVHTNSGVGNYMFYLLVTGGSGTNDKGNAFSVTGIGISEADQILYRTETVYLTATSQYADWRTACINAATDLYGASSNEVIQAENAWYAVGIGTAGGGGGGCGTPTGLASSSITSSTATVSWAAVSGATSYNLQYKISSSSTWTTVSISGTSYSLTGLTASTTYNYQVQAVCASGNSAYSAASSFTTGTGGITYCTSKGATTYEYINKVAAGSISNTSGNNSGYGDYTSLSTSMAQGSSNTITLTPGFASSSYTEYWTVYIDYNHNGLFTDAGETVATGSGTGAVSKSFTVPAAATVAATRMRIQMHYGSSSTNPCATLDYGEVEEYTVNITAGTAACNVPAGLAAGSITSTSAALSWTSTGAASYNLQWKLSSLSTWTTVSALTATSYNLTGLTASTAYQFEVQSVCSAGSSAYSSPVSFTTSSGTVTYCASKGTSTTYEYINKVALGSISNTSGNNSGYGNYTSLSTTLAAGTANTITLTPGFASSSYTEYWTVYIDYNQNGVFTDAGETVATGSGTGAVSKSFTAPTTAKNGATRMRIQMHYGSSSTNSCATLDYGEVEDYTVNITGGSLHFASKTDAAQPFLSVSPNPVSGSNAVVNYTVASDGKVTMKLVDMFGRASQTAELGNQNAGVHIYSFTRMQDLTAGIYFIVLEQDNKMIAKTRIVVSR